jgi:hypothetical protein
LSFHFKKKREGLINARFSDLNKKFRRNLGVIIPTVCSFFARFPPFWSNLGALVALRQQVFSTTQEVAERSQ